MLPHVTSRSDSALHPSPAVVSVSALVDVRQCTLTVVVPLCRCVAIFSCLTLGSLIFPRCEKVELLSGVAPLVYILNQFYCLIGASN